MYRQFLQHNLGQRVVSIRRDAEEYDHEDARVRYPVVIHNFNPSTVANSAHAITSLDPLTLLEHWGSPEISPFAEEIYSGLPYVGAKSALVFGNTEIALMDEERIVHLIVSYRYCLG